MNPDTSGEIALGDSDFAAFSHKSKLDKLNKKTMDTVVHEYTWSYDLLPYEVSAIKSVPDIKGKPILDVGVGTGRTTQELLKVSNDYLGIDYSREMLVSCQNKFPAVNFELADVRDLSAYPDELFYTVFFSSNGICMVNHDDRMSIIKELYRLLKPGGVFMFSAYNQNFLEHRKPFYFPEFGRTFNPLKFVVRSSRFLKNLTVSLMNRARYKSLEIITPEYAIINDRCHNYATMLYYTSPANMQKQLQKCGFTTQLDAFGIDGKMITDHDVIDDTLFYVIRK
jgi:ubiquinone/menaquinone biosynthesis C-methylase UbiE